MKIVADDDPALILALSRRIVNGASRQREGPDPAHMARGPGLLCDNGFVEMGGIEPPSIAEILRLLRAQSVQTFCSAPTFVTDT